MAGSEQLAEAMFFQEPTGALLTARRKLESGIGLSRAEWRLVAQYAQYGTEPGRKVPISAESFAEREYLGNYLLSKTLGQLREKGHYRFVVWVNKKGVPYIASGDEIERVNML